MDTEALKASYERSAPVIIKQARYYFRKLPPYLQDERIQDVLALGWKYWVRLDARGKNPEEVAGALGAFTSRQVSAGRRLMSGTQPKDVMTERPGKRFYVARLPGREHEELYDALVDNRHVTPAEQAAFNIDVKEWMEQLEKDSPRDAVMVKDLVRGEKTGELAEKYGVSAGRISQRRQEIVKHYDQFHGR